MTAPHFTSGLFDFLLELRSNNNRDWFKENKARYDAQVKAPLLRFISDFGPHLRALSPAFVADPRPVGGSLFRIYRDTRFSRDKTPYKTHAAAHFRHARGKDVHAPGFYLHLAPGEVFAGGGIWKPAGDAAKAIRERIVDRPSEWAEAVKGTALVGETLKRPPRGFDREHPLVEDLKRKDFLSTVSFTEAEACGPNFMGLFTERLATMAPLVFFVSDALGLER